MYVRERERERGIETDFNIIGFSSLKHCFHKYLAVTRLSKNLERKEARIMQWGEVSLVWIEQDKERDRMDLKRQTVTSTMTRD